MSHRYSTRIPKQLRVVLPDASALQGDIGNTCVRAARSEHWSTLRYHLRTVLAERPHILFYEDRLAIQICIVASGNLRMLQWIVDAMRGLIYETISFIGSYGNITMLNWMRSATEFWHFEADEPSWLSRAFYNAHTDVLDWALGNGTTMSRLLEHSRYKFRMETLAWYRVHDSELDDIDVDSIIDAAVNGRKLDVLLEVQNIRGDTPYDAAYVLGGIMKGLRYDPNVIDAFVTSGLKMEWKECCIGSFEGMLASIDRNVTFANRESKLAMLRELEFAMIETGLPRYCPDHMNPPSMEKLSYRGEEPYGTNDPGSFYIIKDHV